MTRERFEEEHGPTWQRLALLLGQLERRQTGVEAEQIVALYRRVCQHLALVRHRHLGSDLEERLNALALRTHQHLYRRETPWRRALEYVAAGFPRDVRRQWRSVLLATLLFAGPFLGMFLLARARPEWAHAVLSPEMMQGLEQMYDPASPHHLREREAGSDVAMFGHYIYNNVGIGLRTFAGGILGGLGSIFFLVFNGVVIGAAAGHVTRLEFGHTFWPFVCGHGSFELTAIVLAGASGMRLGAALLMPGQRTRARALQEEARDAVGLIGGFAFMLFVAAGLEAFWSARTSIAAEVKYTVAAFLWAGVFLWLLLGGRSFRRAGPEPGPGAPGGA